MFEKKLLQVIERVHARTVEGSLEWKQEGEDVFYASFGAYTLSIDIIKDYDFPDKPDYYVRIRDKDDNLIEEFSNVSLRGVTGNDSQLYKVLSEIYVGARRKARGTEKVIDSLLESLDDDIPF